MKDLRSRWLALAVLVVSLGTLVGCATLQGDSKQYSGNNALIVVNPQLDFGTVVVGRSKTLNATFLNRTAFGVRITDATIGSPEFKIVAPAMPFSIRPGQSVSLQIQYTPQSAGSSTATAAVATTAPQNSATFAIDGPGSHRRYSLRRAHPASALAARQWDKAQPSLKFSPILVRPA